MGKRGPRPTPRRLKVLRGTDRADRGSQNEPDPPIGAKCPKWLPREAKREWRRLAPWLESQGLLTQADQAAFAGYCAAYARWHRFERLANKESPEVAIGQGFANAATKALHQLTQLLARFGLSPSDRTQVVANPRGEDNPFGEFSKLSRFTRPNSGRAKHDV